jgi:atypical dual specificity phosphatase
MAALSPPPPPPPRSSLLGLLALLLAPALELLRALFKAAVHALPPEARYALSLVAFLPTAGFNRWFCHVFPARRRLWDRVTPAIVLGSAPFTAADVARLHSAEGVRTVVNLCREWDWHGRTLYPRLGILQLHLPTIDYDVPCLRDGLRGARCLAAAEAAGHSAYVHCKAGRGRSTAIVLCYLVLYRGMAPGAADALIRRARPHISKKFESVTVRACAAIRARAVARWAAEGGGGGGAEAAAAAAVLAASSSSSSSSAASSGRPASPFGSVATPRSGSAAAAAVAAAAAAADGGGSSSGGRGGDSEVERLLAATPDGLPASPRVLRAAVEAELRLLLGGGGGAEAEADEAGWGVSEKGAPAGVGGGSSSSSSSSSSSASSSSTSSAHHDHAPSPASVAAAELGAALAYDVELAGALQARGLVTLRGGRRGGDGGGGRATLLLSSGGGAPAAASAGAPAPTGVAVDVVDAHALLASVQTDLVAYLSGVG